MASPTRYNPEERIKFV
jgi:hypothetical protein